MHHRSTPVRVPVDIVWCNRRPVAVLRQLESISFPEPFWLRVANTPTGPVELCPLDTLPDPPADQRPAGFVFHMLRCGSTLTCSLLGTMPGVIALSEPAVFAAIVNSDYPFAERSVWLRRLMHLHVTALCGDRDRLVIKWGSLMTHAIRQFADVFPNVPIAFVHRDPVETLTSCVTVRTRSARMVSPLHLAPHLSVPSDEWRRLPFPERIARFIGSCCHHAAQVPDLRLIDYRELPSIVWGGLTDYFGLPSPSGLTLNALSAESARDAKARNRTFAHKTRRPAATTGPQSLADQFIEPERARLLARHITLQSRSRRATAQSI